MSKPFQIKKWVNACLKKYPAIKETDGRIFIVLQSKWRKNRSAMKFLKPFLELNHRRVYYSFGYTGQKTLCEWHYCFGKDAQLIKGEYGYERGIASQIKALTYELALPITLKLSIKPTKRKK